MAILYSPYIEGSIPAFTSESGLQVPFANNPGVGFNEWNVMTAKITSMSPNSEVSYNLSKIAYVSKYFNNSEKITASKATFIDPVLDNLIPGEFYKVQLAYGENFNEDKTLLNYSTVGVARYLGATNPTIELDPSSDTICKSYTGTYVSPNGITEQEYSYQFIVMEEKNGTNTVFYDTGVQIHNPLNSSDTLYIKKNMSIDSQYNVIYKVTTINGYELEASTGFLPYVGEENITDEKLIPTLNYNNGSIDLSFNCPSSDVSFLERSSSKDQHSVWETLATFVNGGNTKKFNYSDPTVEHGVQYEYSIRAQSGNRYISPERTIEAYFEDAFLTDGERQLCIKYNPKISSMKSNILESKIDTIGSKYPYFFRNGDVNYREFPISGLISYQMDELEKFMVKDKVGNIQSSSDLNDPNVYAERLFREEVTAWLNNGKPKLFRSPAEGNIIVRLMNVSLSPNDTVSRMLSTFSCTAYEIMDYDIDKMKDNGLINPNPISVSDNAIKYETIYLSDYYDSIVGSNEYYIIKDLGDNGLILTAEFKNFKAGDKIKYDTEEIIFNATGMMVKNSPAAAIGISKDIKGFTGVINISYYEGVSTI